MRFIFKLIAVCFIIATSKLLAQHIHVTYKHVRSPIASITEDLYVDIKGKRTLSVQDSIATWADGDKMGSRTLPQKFYYISTLGEDKNRVFNYTTPIDKENFLIFDDVPKINWNIIPTQTKKVAGYLCTKATTVFRGAHITAYFAKELPYSAGPFKFFGLPGLILEVAEDNMPYNIWKATKVETAKDFGIKYTPHLKYRKIILPEWVALYDEARLSRRRKARMDVGANLKDVEKKTPRMSLEKIYEWENP